jgi:cbb3-type cytochrome oxidase subunit 3
MNLVIFLLPFLVVVLWALWIKRKERLQAEYDDLPIFLKKQAD